MNLTRTYLYVTFHRETKRFYIGSRTIWAIEPEDDFLYLGSGRWINEMAYEGTKLEKEILKISQRRQDIKRLELKLINSFWDNPLSMNRAKWVADCSYDDEREYAWIGKRNMVLKDLYA
jgi:hypothetical protein